MANVFDGVKKIGIFDSGRGAESVYRVLKKAFPAYKYIVFKDSTMFPYGEKSIWQLKKRVREIYDHMVAMGVDHVVCACCSLSWFIETGEIEQRSGGRVKLISMLKPTVALLQESKPEGLLWLATKVSVAHLKNMKHGSFLKNAKKIKFIDGSRLIEEIEYDLENKSKLMETLSELISEHKEKDTGHIFFGCTHFGEIKEMCRLKFGDKIKLLDPIEKIPDEILSCESKIDECYTQMC